jgi:hypothetical protein
MQCHGSLPVLVSAGLLKPLGHPPATAELLAQMKDRVWLVKVTNALNQHWQKKNAAKKNGSPNGHVLPDGHANAAV